MIIAVQGTKTFDDYPVFMRAMAVAMSGIQDEDKDILVYSVGPRKVNDFVTEFCNITERSLKARGIRIKFFRVPAAWAEENVSKFNYFAFLSNPGEKNSKLVSIAEISGTEVGTFRFKH
jgi:hypothetical protein